MDHAQLRRSNIPRETGGLVDVQSLTCLSHMRAFCTYEPALCLQSGHFTSFPPSFCLHGSPPLSLCSSAWLIFSYLFPHQKRRRSFRMLGRPYSTVAYFCRNITANICGDSWVSVLRRSAVRTTPRLRNGPQYDSRLPTRAGARQLRRMLRTGLGYEGYLQRR